MMDTSSSYSIAVADIVNQRTKPAMQLMAQSPEFNIDADKQWSQRAAGRLSAAAS